MVVGVGIGTELSLNGTAAHAFTGVLYLALLFMSMGAVLFRTDTINGSELGGLSKSMPWSAGFCIIGALSISAFPLTGGFVSEVAHHFSSGRRGALDRLGGLTTRLSRRIYPFGAQGSLLYLFRARQWQTC